MHCVRERGVGRIVCGSGVWRILRRVLIYVKLTIAAVRWRRRIWPPRFPDPLFEWPASLQQPYHSRKSTSMLTRRGISILGRDGPRGVQDPMKAETGRRRPPAATEAAGARRGVPGADRGVKKPARRGWPNRARLSPETREIPSFRPRVASPTCDADHLLTVLVPRRPLVRMALLRLLLSWVLLIRERGGRPRATTRVPGAAPDLVCECGSPLLESSHRNPHPWLLQRSPFCLR
jgi:hypothetical protein